MRQDTRAGQNSRALFEPMSILRHPEVILSCHCSQEMLIQAEASFALASCSLINVF